MLMACLRSSRSDSTARKRSVPGTSGDFMETIFRDGKFSGFSGVFRLEVPLPFHVDFRRFLSPRSKHGARIPPL